MANPRRTHSTSGSLIVLASVVLTLYFAREVLIPLALALTVSFLLAPVVKSFEKLRIGRAPAVVLVMLIALGLLGFAAWIVTNQLVEVAGDLPEYRNNIRNRISALHAPNSGPLGKVAQVVSEIGRDLTSRAPAPRSPLPARGARQPAAPTQVQVVTPENGIENLRDVLVSVAKPLGIVGVVIVFTVFILIQREDLRDRLLRLVGMGKLNAMTEALDDGAQRISRYLVMQLAVNAGYGFLFGLGLLLIGVPHALLWGAIAAVIRIVPYVGAFAAAMLPLLLSLAVFSDWLPPLLVFLLYAVLEGVVGNFIEPWLYGAHTGVSSLALLVTTVFWTLIWGWAGLILSTPLTVCVIVLGQHAPQWSFLHILLGDEAPLTPEAQFYQRLLAMDQVEARTIAERYLKDKPLVDLYDHVVLPALNLAEQDRHRGSIDQTRETFFFLSASEIIAELADHKAQAAPDAPETAGFAISAVAAPVSANRVICVPANDQADEIAGIMLAQLLEQSGHIVLAFAVGSPWSDALESLSLGPDDIVCISSVPPFAFSHARAACRTIRSVAPRVKVIAGLWGYPGDIERTKERFGKDQPTAVLTTLTATLQTIFEWGGGEGDAINPLTSDIVNKPVSQAI